MVSTIQNRNVNTVESYSAGSIEPLITYNRKNQPTFEEANV